jgi:hypothetical protein
VTVVQVIDVTAVLDCGMAAMGTVLMLVKGVVRFVAIGHPRLLIQAMGEDRPGVRFEGPSVFRIPRKV